MEFGLNILWLDCVDNYSQPEIRLELNTDDVEKARDFLEENGTMTCDEIEKISDGHWIADPAGSIFVLKKRS